MRDWTVYLGAYCGPLATALIYHLIGKPFGGNLPDVLFGVTIVLFLDKCIANPFWKT